MKSPQQVLSREQLLAASRVHAEDVYDRSVDVQILRLRRKLEVNPSEPALIKTERGVGYIFTLPVDVVSLRRKWWGALDLQGSPVVPEIVQRNVEANRRT